MKPAIWISAAEGSLTYDKDIECYGVSMDQLKESMKHEICYAQTDTAQKLVKYIIQVLIDERQDDALYALATQILKALKNETEGLYRQTIQTALTAIKEIQNDYY